MRRKLEPKTPFIADNWEILLQAADLTAKYPTLVHSIRHGFDVGIPPVTTTHTPPNSNTLYKYPRHFLDIIAHEYEKDRYIGPFTRRQLEEIIGPFQSSPLSLVPKPHKIDAYRLVQNYSYPRIPSPEYISINMLLDPSDYPCTWGTFRVVCLLIIRLPPGTQGAVRDVSEAYRNIALHFSQWPGTVVCTGFGADDEFAIDPNASFGLSPNSGIFGGGMDGGGDIMRSKGIGPFTKWVDDHFFLRIRRRYLEEYNRWRQTWRQRIENRGGAQKQGGRLWYNGDNLPDDSLEEFDEDMKFPLQDLSQRTPRSAEDQEYTYNFDDINWITDLLGIPWALDKDISWRYIVPFIGFEWDLEAKRVAIGDKKKQKYRAAIAEWQGSQRHDLREVQRLYGKLLHASLVVPRGRAYLTTLEATLGIYHNEPYRRRYPVRGTDEDIRWWDNLLQQPTLSRSIPRPVPIHDLAAFSDASSGVGIGIVIGNRWRAWTFVDNWDDGRGIAWAEAVGFELLVRALLENGGQGRVIKVYGDNKVVVEGWGNGRSRNRHVNPVFRRIHNLLDAAGADIIARYVPSANNPADNPSRGIFPSDTYLLPPIDLPADVAHLLIEYGTSRPRARYRQGALAKPQRARSRERLAAQALASSRHDEELVLTSVRTNIDDELAI